MKFIYIYDCVSGKLRVGQTCPLSIGNAPEAGALVTMLPGICGVVMSRGSVNTFFPKLPYECNGAGMEGSFNLEDGKGYLIACNGGLFLMLCSPVPPQAQQMLFASYNKDAWYYYTPDLGGWQGPLTAMQLNAMADRLNPASWVTMTGMGQDNYCSLNAFREMARRFYAVQPQQPVMPVQPQQPVMPVQPQQPVMPVQPQQPVMPVQPQQPVMPVQPQQPVMPVQPQQTNAAVDDEEEEEEYEMPEIDEHSGRFLCPVCWLRFDAGDVMSIASHPDLMGDPVLGRDAMLRFQATRFNARGQALDDKGMPCMHLACPHCRHKLPPRFLEIEEMIFSIIGAPSSGKSYYLASFIHEMAYKVAPEFNLAWRDADPAGNSQLNDVSNRLFSAATPQQAYLSKTDLEGALYEEFYRHGRMVKLPKPFVFNLSKMQSKKPPLSLVFYDNAGEHFEPGRNNEDSPGAMHVAVASGLFFLFDPTSCPAFRKLITHREDPQLNSSGMQLDQQAIIMAETESRIASILNTGPGEQISTPFAVLIGKCDLWEDYLSTPEGGGKPLLPAVVNGKLIRENVEANSQRLRKLMMKIQPAICTTAESISDNVRYFAISQLGCSPVTFEDELTGVTRIGPDPNGIAPRYMCDATLWMLSLLAPDYIPSV